MVFCIWWQKVSVVSWRFLTSKIAGTDTKSEDWMQLLHILQQHSTQTHLQQPGLLHQAGSGKHWFLVWIFPCCGNPLHRLLPAKLPEHFGSTATSGRHCCWKWDTWRSPGTPEPQQTRTTCCFRWPEAQTGICRGCDTAPQAAFHWTNLPARLWQQRGAFTVSSLHWGHLWRQQMWDIPQNMRDKAQP